MTTPTQQIIQRGTYANDGQGDTLRDAAQKINDNFTYIWDEVFSLVDSDQEQTDTLSDHELRIVTLESLSADLRADVDANSALISSLGTASNVIDGSPTGGASDDF